MSNEVLAALSGAALTATVGLIAAWLSDRRLHQSWYRDKLFGAYSDAIYYLTKLDISSASEPITSKDVRQHRSESIRHVTLLCAFAPLSDKAKLQEILSNISAATDQAQLTAAARQGQQAVETILRQDKKVVAALG